MNNRETYEALPHQIQQAVARDWLERKRNGHARGLGIGSHYNFLLWVAEEYGIDMGDLLSLTNN
jgi:hypothetical protein